MTVRKRTTKADSGSPSTGEPEYLVVGTLRRPHGLRGEILMDVITDFPERLLRGVKLFVGSSREPRIIDSCRQHSRGMLIQLRGISSPEAAGSYRQQAVYVLAANRPRLPKGQYYHHELVGSKVVDENQQTLGVLAEILQTGANDVYVVKGAPDRELLLPAIAGVLLEIDSDRRMIQVRVPNGIDPQGTARRPRRRATDPMPDDSAQHDGR